MYAVLKSFGLSGLRGFGVAVEADVSGGMDAFSIVGLPDSAVRESADRVRAAVRNLHRRWPSGRVTVNLGPCRCPQNRSGLRPAPSAGGTGRLGPDRPAGSGCCLSGRGGPGRLSAAGDGRSSMALAAAEQGIQALFVPADNAAEAAEACGDSGMQVYPAASVSEVIARWMAAPPCSRHGPSPSTRMKAGPPTPTLPMCWVRRWPGGPWWWRRPAATTFC